jgi:hypothetical protein
MHEDAVRAGGDVRGVRELQASRFTLVDRYGNARAALMVGEDGSPAIHFFDPGQQPRMSLALEASGAANVKVLDPNGDVRIWMSVNPNGAPSLYLRGTSRYADGGTGHAELAIDEHGTPAFSLCDTAGTPRLLLGLDEKAGVPRLSLSGPDGELRALLMADRERGTLHLYPDDGMPERDVPALQLRARGEPEPEAITEPAPATVVVTPLEPPPALAAMVPPSEADAESNGRAVHLKEPLEAPVRPRRSRRRWLRAAVPLLVLVVAGLGAAAYSALTTPSPALERDAAGTAGTRDSHSVEAEEFVLRAPNGDVHARLGLLPDGSPFLQLTGSGGTSSAELSVLPSQGPALKLSDGKALVSMRAKGDGSSEITLHSEGQEPRAALFLESDGSPVLSLTDAEGRVRAGLTISTDGSPSLSLYDESSLRAMLGTSGDRSMLTLLDGQGRLLYSAPSR